MRSFLLSLLTGLLFSTVIHAQVATGTPPFSSTAGGPDVVNLYNLNVHWAFPIVNKPGRGLPFAYNLTFDDSPWYPVTSGGITSWQAVSNFGWNVQTSAMTGYIAEQVQTYTCQFGYRGESYNTFTVNAYSAYVDQSGTSHPFNLVIFNNLNPSPGGCGPGGSTGSNIASDGSGISLNASGTPTITFKNGTTTQPPVNSKNGSGSATDANGNQISTPGNGSFSDTLGTTALSIASGPQANQYSYSYSNPPGVSPATSSIVVTYTPKTVQTNFGCANIHEYGPTANVLLPTSIAYPDGSSYGFSYELTPSGPNPVSSGAVTGRLAQVILPTGGTISYTYFNGNNGINCSDGSTAAMNRYTPDSSNPWVYGRGGTSSGWQTNIADPSGNYTSVFFNGGYEVQRQFYQGAISAANLLETLTTCYNGTALASCPTAAVSFPFSSRAVYAQWPTGLTNEVNTIYTGPELPAETDEYDFGSNNPGALLRKTLTGYASLGNGIVDRVSSVTVEDPSNNPVAQTLYNYDEGTLQPSTNYSPAVQQHIAVTGSRGNLTSIQSWLNPGNQLLPKTKLVYDDTGDVLSTTDPGGHTTSFAYSNNYAYVSQVTLPVTHSPNAANHVITAVYDSNTGLVTSTTDQNKNPTNYSYDAMLRPIETDYPDGGKTTEQYVYAGTPPTMLSQVLTWSYLDSTHYTDFRQAVDPLGRFNRTAYWNAQGSWDMQDTCFDADGRVHFISYAYQDPNGWGDPSVCSGAGDTYSYDALNRTTQVKHSDGSSANYSYSGRAEQIQDEGNGFYNATRILQTDALGHLVAVCEIGSTPLNTPAACGLDIGGTGFLTSYGYDLLNNVTQINQSGYATRTYGFDSLSRKTSESFPEQFENTTSYTYNNDSLPQTRLRPAPNNASGTVTTTYTYDEMHRLRSSTYNDNATEPSSYNYDEASVWTQATTNPLGRLTSAYANNSANTVTEGAEIYPLVDSMGRTQLVGKCTPRTCGWGGYNNSYTYDDLGDVTGFNNGVNTSFAYYYNSAARLTTFNDSLTPGTLVSSASYTPVGPSSITLGNGLTESYGYTARGFAQSYAAGNRYNYALQYANNGNISLANDSVTGGWGFQYDQFNRLTAVDYPDITWVYDRFGNRWQQNSTVGGPQPQYTFDSNNHITGSGVVYDALGNVVNDGIGHAYTYDAENRIIAMTSGGNTFNYIYDALGRRVAIQQNGVLLDEFLYDQAGRKVVSFDGSGNLVAQELYAGNRHLATYLSSTNQMYFHHTDWLGTVRIDTDASGNQAQICYSWPFGDNRSCNGVFTSANLFTDLFLDPDNSVHAQYRQLSTTQGRWLSPDPAGVAAADLTNPQSLNLYAYVLNAPTNYFDPLGLVCSGDYGLGETPCNNANSGGGGGSGSFAGYGEFGLMGIPVMASGDRIYGYLRVPIMSNADAGVGGVTSINELEPIYGPQSFATDLSAFDLVGTSFLSSVGNAWQTMTSQIAKYVPQVCSKGGFGYAAANIPLAPHVGIESVGLVEYDSKDGGSHGGLLGLELGPTVLGVESIRTWKDWQAHTGPIGLAGDEFHAASQMFGKNVKLGTFDGGGFVNWMNGELNIGGYLGGKIFGGGGYVSLSWSGCK